MLEDFQTWILRWAFFTLLRIGRLWQSRTGRVAGNIYGKVLLAI
jgi:hypothetical protein